MPPPDLQPGDTVIDLAAAARTAGLLSGAVSAAVLTWMLRHSGLYSTLGFFGGAVVGFGLGAIAGALLFRAGPGMVIITKAGATSLQGTLKAALAGSLFPAAAAALLFSTLSAQRWQVFTGTSLGIGVLIGIGLALMSSYL